MKIEHIPFGKNRIRLNAIAFMIAPGIILGIILIILIKIFAK